MTNGLAARLVEASEIASAGPKSASGSEHPRGIRPAILRSQVENTVPFVFRANLDERSDWIRRAPYLKFLLDLPAGNDLDSVHFSHVDYFRLCLVAHWATVGSFVPTDVDHQIRHKLWHPRLNDSELAAMVEITLEARTWPYAPLSNRHTVSGIAGHQGEWLSVAVAAYAATRHRLPDLALILREQIEHEVTREAKIYLEVRKSGDGLELLRASTMIAHNLGDLDRVCEAWALPPEDPLVQFAYKAGHEEGDARRFNGALSESGRLNKALMSPENHRHLALRTPRALRSSVDFLLPIAPFFDGWGAHLARHPTLGSRDFAEIIDALVIGWEKLKGPDRATITFAYPRAVAGILENFPGGMGALNGILPARVSRDLKSGLFRSLTAVSQARFEEQWAQMALNFVSGKQRQGTPDRTARTASSLPKASLDYGTNYGTLGIWGAFFARPKNLGIDRYIRAVLDLFFQRSRSLTGRGFSCPFGGCYTAINIK